MMRLSPAILLCLFLAGVVRSNEPPFHQVDLEQFVNQPLDEDFHPGDYPGDSLEELKPGQTELEGIPFGIASGVIQLAGEFLPDHPHSVEDMPVGHRTASLHFLHAARWGAYGKRGHIRNHWVPDGTPIGFYEIVYEDEHVEAIPIVYGADVRDWWNVWDNSRPTTRSKVVWNGNNPFVRRVHERDEDNPGLRLFLTTWQNPHPEKTISAISFVSVEQVATPFCVAITLQTTEAEAEAGIRKPKTGLAQRKAQAESSENAAKPRIAIEFVEIDDADPVIRLVPVETTE